MILTAAYWPVCLCFANLTLPNTLSPTIGSDSSLYWEKREDITWWTLSHSSPNSPRTHTRHFCIRFPRWTRSTLSTWSTFFLSSLLTSLRFLRWSTLRGRRSSCSRLRRSWHSFWNAFLDWMRWIDSVEIGRRAREWVWKEAREFVERLFVFFLKEECLAK